MLTSTTGSITACSRSFSAHLDRYACDTSEAVNTIGAYTEAASTKRLAEEQGAPTSGAFKEEFTVLYRRAIDCTLELDLTLTPRETRLKEQCYRLKKVKEKIGLDPSGYHAQVKKIGELAEILRGARKEFKRVAAPSSIPGYTHSEETYCQLLLARNADQAGKEDCTFPSEND